MSSRPLAFHEAISDGAESRMEAVAESGRGSTTCTSAVGGGERASLVTCYIENPLSVTSSSLDEIDDGGGIYGFQGKKKRKKSRYVRTEILLGFIFDSCLKRAAFSATAKSSKKAKTWP